MAENIENNGCSQRDNAEHEGYVKASRSFNRIWKERDSAQPRLLEAILYKDNFNRAYKRVIQILYFWMNRRSQRKSYTWDGFNQFLKEHPIVRPRIYVSLYG